MKIKLPVTASHLYLFGLVLLAVSLPFSNYLMSVSQFILGGAWLLDRNYKEKLTRFWNNKAAVAICSLFLLHIIGLLYTTDFNYGLEDVRKKVTLFLLPFLIASSAPLSEKQFRMVLVFFCMAVTLATIYSAVLLGGFLGNTILSAREISPFISHIRFGLMICFAIFVMIYFISAERHLFAKIFQAAVAGWLAVYLFISESITGLICFIAALIILVFAFSLKQKRLWMKIAGTGLVVAAVSGILVYLKATWDDLRHIRPVDVSVLETHTKRGNKYEHFPNDKQVENGNLIWVYVCWPELEQAWNQRSKMNFSGKDLCSNEIRYTLTRFLASKGLRKDADGVASLSDGEVRSIERGVANVKFQDATNIHSRIHQTLWEIALYMDGGNPSGHSIPQRIEYWRAAIGIIKDHFLSGVGTGDVKTAYAEQYEKMNSPLRQEYRLRAHNQFLAIGTAFGLTGMVWFIFSLLYPVFRKKKFEDFLFVAFFIPVVLSFFTEDTLETQAGATFFAFFNSVLLLGAKESTG
jgi:hypothetical protein